jgi:2-keto-4-pentenoate hydratase/predicted N-acetyltransferase YhbS
VEVRAVRPEELQTAGEVTVAAYAAPRELPIANAFRSELADVGGRLADAEVLVAVEGHEVIGSVTYVPGPTSRLAEFEEPLTAGIRMLAVAPGIRNRGIGRALVSACIERAAASGCERLVLHTTHWMHDVQRLSTRLGFERVPALDREPEPGLHLQAYRYWLDAAPLLAEVRDTRRALPRLAEHLVPDTLEDAYRVQDRLVGLLGARVVGWKVSATSAGVQQQLGLSSPVSGRLLEGHVHPPGTHLQLDRFVGHPSRAGTIVFRLNADLAEGPFNAPAVAGAVAEVSAGLEVLDSRFVDPTGVGVLALVADNGLAGDLVVGAGRPVKGLWDPRDLAVSVVADGVTLAEGRASDALGGPLHVLAWLAGHLAAQRRPLRAGDLVATGSCTGLVALPVGSGAIQACLGPADQPWLVVEASCS